jgi:hypothetical protein
MSKLINDWNVIIIPEREDIKHLANQYIEAGAIPKTMLNDALHIAASAIHGLDFVVSLNFQHIVKDKAKRITALINKNEGFGEVGIFEPKELIDYEEH